MKEKSVSVKDGREYVRSYDELSLLVRCFAAHDFLGFILRRITYDTLYPVPSQAFV